MVVVPEAIIEEPKLPTPRLQTPSPPPKEVP